MSITKLHRVVFCALLCLGIAIGSTQVIAAQDAGQSSRTSPEIRNEDQTNFAVELHLILASNTRAGDNQLPASLDQVAKQLRATLPYKNYSLVSTIVNRVKNGSSLSLTSIGGSLMVPTTAAAHMPTFNDFSIGFVKVVADPDGGPLVQMQKLSFGSRFPMQTGTDIAQAGNNAAPVFSYERTGITTDLSLRIGEPAVVGTLNLGPSGDAIIVIICARRAPK